jgi:hypothetical protein
MSNDEFRDLTRDFLSTTLKENVKTLERHRSLKESNIEEVAGEQPMFHDADMDRALNSYIERFVMHLEEDLGETRASTMLLEVMKQYLVDGLEAATLEAQASVGLR